MTKAPWMGTVRLRAARSSGKQKLPPAKFSIQEEFQPGSTFIQQEATVMVRRGRHESVYWVSCMMQCQRAGW